MGDATDKGVMGTDSDRQRQIRDTLDALGVLCPAGYSAALHFGFHSPDYLIQSYSPDWREEYTAQSYVLNDPALHWGMAHEGTIAWSDIPGSADNPMMRRAAQSGLTHGFCCAIGAPEGRSIFNGARADSPYTAGEMATGARLFGQLHDLTRDLDTLSEETEAALRARTIDVTRG